MQRNLRRLMLACSLAAFTMLSIATTVLGVTTGGDWP